MGEGKLEETGGGVARRSYERVRHSEESIQVEVGDFVLMRIGGNLRVR